MKLKSADKELVIDNKIISRFNLLNDIAPTNRNKTNYGNCGDRLRLFKMLRTLEYRLATAFLSLTSLFSNINLSAGQEELNLFFVFKNIN